MEPFFQITKKIPLILPLFHENKFVTDFKEKSEILMDFLQNNAS